MRRVSMYARASNPTRDALERCVAALESCVRGLAFASGMAATANVLELLNAGEHVIAPAELRAWWPPWNHESFKPVGRGAGRTGHTR